MISFVATAGIVVLFLIQYYLFSFDPRLNPFQSVGDQFKPNAFDLFFLRFVRRKKLDKISPAAAIQKKRDRRTLNWCVKTAIDCTSYRKMLICSVQCVLGLSDLQIGTGFAILIGGYASLSCGLSSYHWQVTVYLAWFSASTHLAAMTFLRSFFHRNSEKRTWRVIAMFLFLTMLMIGISPTGNYWMSTRPSSDAICSFGRHVKQNDTVNTELVLTNGTVLTNGSSLLNGTRLIDGTLLEAEYPVEIFSPLLGQYVCEDSDKVFLTSYSFYSFASLQAINTTINRRDGNISAMALSGDSHSSAIVSIVILVFSFGVRLIKLHRRSSEWLSFKLRKRISLWVTHRLHQVRTWSNPNRESMHWKRTLVYRPLLVTFILSRLVLDLYSSLFAEV
jgi:hypothetical protein